MYKKIDRTDAEKLYESGHTVYICPCKQNINALFGDPEIFRQAVKMEFGENRFSEDCKKFRDAACNVETGKNLKYYRE
jgi:hypothetical protein